MIKNTDIKRSTEEITKSINGTTKRIIDALQDGGRITIQELIKNVADETQIKQPIVSGLVRMYVDAEPGISLRNGRDGGVFKGEKPKRVDTRPRCETCKQVLPKHKDCK